MYYTEMCIPAWLKIYRTYFLKFLNGNGGAKEALKISRLKSNPRSMWSLLKIEKKNLNYYMLDIKISVFLPKITFYCLSFDFPKFSPLKMFPRLLNFMFIQYRQH